MLESPIMDDFLAYLAEHDIAGLPGLTDDALADLGRDLGVELPDPVRELYRVCGGLDEDAVEYLPMRLMSPDEATTVVTILAGMAETYRPARDARYLFTDDNSNWAGAYVTGPLTGMVVLLDHEDPSPAPRFVDLDSFLVRLVETGRAEGDHTDLVTDFPLRPDAPPELAARAAPLARLFLDRYRARAGAVHDHPDVLVDLDIGLHLLPPGDRGALDGLREPAHPVARSMIARLAPV
jgi:hypothetical protein